MGKTAKDFVSGAKARVKTVQASEIVARAKDPGVVFVDVRDEPELRETGKVAGAVHASRGMLEFHLDASTPYHLPVLRSGKEIVFYCKSGGRSALAAERATEMGIENVATLEGGLPAWRDAGGPIEPHG